MTTRHHINKFPLGTKVAIFPEQPGAQRCVYCEQSQRTDDGLQYLLVCIGQRNEWNVFGLTLGVASDDFSIENEETLSPDDKERRCVEILRDLRIKCDNGCGEQFRGRIVSDKGAISVHHVMRFENYDVPSVIMRAIQAWKERFPDRNRAWTREIYQHHAICVGCVLGGAIVGWMLRSTL